jgi:ketosteroid isomerase-like protein
MSQENIDIVLRAVDMNRSDSSGETLEAVVALFHPDGVFTSRLASVEGGAYLGREGARRYFRDMEDAFTDWRNDGSDAKAVGPDGVLVDVVFRGTSKSGVAVELPSTLACRVSEGMIIQMHAHPTREEALQAADLRR